MFCKLVYSYQNLKEKLYLFHVDYLSDFYRFLLILKIPALCLVGR